MKLALILNGVTSLGPNSRLCVWFAGCPHNCSGCGTPELRSVAGFKDVDILSKLKTYSLDNITGLTVSGGEPFMQPSALNDVLEFALSNGITDTLVFSGYTLDELLAMDNPDVRSALEKISVLVDGRYVESLDIGQRLQGSTNQKMHIFDERLNDVYAEYSAQGRKVQVAYAEGGVHLAGLMPKKNDNSEK